MIQIEQHDPHAVLLAEPSVLEPLWLALFDHHVANGAAGMPTRARAGSWPQRRAHFLATVGGSPQASLWIATNDGATIGYALSFEDTLHGERIEVLESLSLLPAARGQGLGGELVATVEGSVRGRGIGRVAIDVMGGNTGALRFYARAGYVEYSKTWMRSAPAGRGSSDIAPGDVKAAEDALSEIGVGLAFTGRSDDTWVTAPSVALLDAAGATLPEGAVEAAAWLSALLRGVQALADAGYWTVWIEVLEGDGATLLGEELVARGFSHGMTRVLKTLRAVPLAE